MRGDASASTRRAPPGRRLPNVHGRARCGSVSMSKSSISRRAPTMPMPMPVVERSAVQHRLEVGDAWAAGRDTAHQRSRRVRRRPRTRPGRRRHSEGVAGDLGHRGRDARLVLAVEAQQPAICAGALARAARRPARCAQGNACSSGSLACASAARRRPPLRRRVRAHGHVQHGGDQRRVAREQPGIRVEVPARAPARPSASPAAGAAPHGIRERLDRARRCARRAVVRDQRRDAGRRRR